MFRMMISKKKRKLVVFKSNLDQLLIPCQFCAPICKTEKCIVGIMVINKVIFHQNHIFNWKLQPVLHNKPSANILIPAATISSAPTYNPVKQFAYVWAYVLWTRARYRMKFFFPVINNAHKIKQQKNINKRIYKNSHTNKFIWWWKMS